MRPPVSALRCGLTGPWVRNQFQDGFRFPARLPGVSDPASAGLRRSSAGAFRAVPSPSVPCDASHGGGREALACRETPSGAGDAGLNSPWSERRPALDRTGPLAQALLQLCKSASRPGTGQERERCSSEGSVVNRTISALACPLQKEVLYRETDLNLNRRLAGRLLLGGKPMESGGAAIQFFQSGGSGRKPVQWIYPAFRGPLHSLRRLQRFRVSENASN